MSDVPQLPIDLEPLAQRLYGELGLAPYGGTTEDGRWHDSWKEKAYVRRALAEAYLAGIDKKENMTMAIKFRPLADKLLVKPAAAEEKIGSIIVPDNAKEKPVRGEVLAVGNGRALDDGTRVPIAVKPGDVVLYGKYAGTDVRVNGEDAKILKEEDILGVVEDP